MEHPDDFRALLRLKMEQHVFANNQRIPGARGLQGKQIVLAKIDAFPDLLDQTHLAVRVFLEVLSLGGVREFVPLRRDYSWRRGQSTAN